MIIQTNTITNIEINTLQDLYRLQHLYNEGDFVERNND